jgi:hypothetical protein
MVLCDFAQVREGLLFVSSGGVSRVVSTSYPARLHLYLALVVHLPPSEMTEAHRMRVRFKYPDSATQIAHVDVAMQLNEPAAVFPGEGINMPSAIDLANILFPRPGQIDVQIDIDDQLAGDLSFWLLESARPPAIEK